MDNRINVLEHITSSNPQDTKAGSFEIGLSKGIDARLAPTIMRLTVNLDEEPS